MIIIRCLDILQTFEFKQKTNQFVKNDKNKEELSAVQFQVTTLMWLHQMNE